MTNIIQTARQITLGDIIGGVSVFALIPLVMFAGLVLS